MALRRGLGGVLSSLGRLALTEGAHSGLAGPLAAQPAPTLVCLRSVWPVGRQGAAAVGQECSSGPRAFSAAAAPRQAAAESPAAAAAAVAGEESLEQIRARIFGTHIGNGLRSGRKVLRRPLLGQKLVDWYPSQDVGQDPLMLNIKAENANIKVGRLRHRGKGPPKKGAGKRAGKKK
ncbi:28S ribosomal mitochondrial-like [Micractinium conductrix]|uniref:Small ribosomal subunit protein mS33 n=1 Tax=Micractinium conductrix TaxID=554055 RepID=A0A2P6V1E9_9CHLO|nr:28S ribosomal mitochondrial-like [Micractinium conductrix]|eukprot:PSC67922.1 28S ribosomal mitochondrial-like [Micractinium conductrix]